MYYLSFIYLWILYFLEKKKEKDLKVFALIPFLVVPLLRFGVGSDYFSYQRLYDYLPLNSWTSFWDAYPDIEVGFKLLMGMGRFFRLPYHLFIAILSIGLSLFLYQTISQKEDGLLSLILYYSLFYFAWNLNAIRQGLVLFVFSAFYFQNEEQKFYKYLILVLFLSLFHASALILIPILLLTHLNLKWFHFLFYLLLALLLNQLPIVGIVEAMKDIPYLGKSYYYIDQLGSPFLSFSTLVRLALYGLGLFYFYKINQEEGYDFEKRISKYYLIGLGLYFYFKPIEILASRSSVYGYFAIVLLLPFLYRYYHQSKYRFDWYILGFIFLFSSFGVYKELHAAAEQAGYLKSPVKLNTLTIFNRDRDDFYNSSNIMYNIKDHYKDDYDNFFAKKDLSLHSPKDKQYLAVQFPGTDLFGIIDRQGNVIEEARYDYRPKVYDQYVQEKSGILEKKDLDYRIVGTDNLIQTYRIIDRVRDIEANEVNFKSINFTKEKLEFDDIDHASFNHFFRKNENGRMEQISINIPFDYEIIQTHLRMEPVIMITELDGEKYESKLYLSVEPYQGLDILRAETHFHYEYINRQGKVIWMEKKDN